MIFQAVEAMEVHLHDSRLRSTLCLLVLQSRRVVVAEGRQYQVVPAVQSEKGVAGMWQAAEEEDHLSQR